MRVQITYPDSFQLHGWDRSIFDFQLRGLFDGQFMDICAVDKLRKKLGAEATPESKILHEDLRLLHCGDYAKMDNEILLRLPGKVGEYLGVTIEHKFFKSRKPFWGIAAALLVAVAVGAVAYASSHLKGPDRPDTFSPAVRQDLSYLPSIPRAAPVQDAEAGMPCTEASIICTTTTDTRPAEALKRIGALATGYPAGRYRIHAIVELIPDEDSSTKK